MNKLNLMQFSPGGGCGCKISPKHLSSILESSVLFKNDLNLIVGNEFKDDAAVYSIDEENAIISTTDFFTPITNDAKNFGMIASANAISDVYAMGGTPITALAILGFPIDTIPISVASDIMNGAREMCKEAGIILSGGHSINIDTPIFGLAVTGKIKINNIKRNNTATKDCKLFLTKPIGTGVLSTAEKKGLLSEEDYCSYIKTPKKLNDIGALLSEVGEVKAMTDVTGFGLAGHILEMCGGNNLIVNLYYDRVPILSSMKKYIGASTPSGTSRNWESYKENISILGEKYRDIICDPQTNGGLLIAVEDSGINKLRGVAKKHNTEIYEIGFLKITLINQKSYYILFKY